MDLYVLRTLSTFRLLALSNDQGGLYAYEYHFFRTVLALHVDFCLPQCILHDYGCLSVSQQSLRLR
jgi:hypothetical protein